MFEQSGLVSSPSRARFLTFLGTLAEQRCIHASGSREVLGLRQGATLGVAIRDFLADRVTRIGALLDRETNLGSLFPDINRYARIISATLPGMAREIEGLAAGADISLEEAYLLQLRRELVGYQNVQTGGDCTTFARLGKNAHVLGQTVDLNGDMGKELTVLQLENTDTGRRLLLVSFSGLLGYLGMNDRGIAIGINLVLSGEWRPGIPAYMAIRHLLDEAESVEQCLHLLRRMPLASSRALTILDCKRLVSVEYILNEMVVLEGDELIHTNHFLHPDFQTRDRLNRFARVSSQRRLQSCKEALGEISPDAEIDAYLDMLLKPPIWVAKDDNIRRECSVAAIVMRPDLGTMVISRGPNLRADE